MKKTNLYTVLAIIAFFGLIQINSSAQDTLVQWTFPSDTGVADGGCIPANLIQEIETAGGTSAIQFKNGLTTKAAQATGWHNGTDAKKWKVEFETTGYTNITLSSKITSGGSNPGPRDFKIQYKVGSGAWTDVANSEFQTANDWTTGVLNDLAIPNSCSNQSSVQIRWIMTSDTASNGSIVDSTGTSKIDDIIIKGAVMINVNENIISDSKINIYPNPTTDYLNIESNTASIITLYNIIGEEIISLNSNNFEKIDVSELNSGIYLLKIEDLTDKSVILRKIIVQ
ncbi:MAG: T9SS type A sorting domain-containing protein [Saprospiraceae bacterium]|nr:T9SS type A sorting domain-containing protein [Saprospiraceae bacterium]